MTKTIKDYEEHLRPYIAAAQAALNELAAQVNAVEPLIDKETADPKEAAALLFHIKEANTSLDKNRSRFGGFVQMIERSVVPHALERSGVDMIRVPELARSFSIQQKLSASLIDKEKGMDWLRNNGLADLIAETVNAGTLSSAVRRMILDQGIEPPEDLIRVTTYNAIGIARYNPK